MSYTHNKEYTTNDENVYHTKGHVGGGIITCTFIG